MDDGYRVMDDTCQTWPAVDFLRIRPVIDRFSRKEQCHSDGNRTTQHEPLLSHPMRESFYLHLVLAMRP